MLHVVERHGGIQDLYSSCWSWSGGSAEAEECDATIATMALRTAASSTAYWNQSWIVLCDRLTVGRATTSILVKG